MRFTLIAYWLTGCLMVGGGAAQHANRCPNDKENSGVDLLAYTIIWPVIIVYSYHRNGQLSRCEQEGPKP